MGRSLGFTSSGIWMAVGLLASILIWFLPWRFQVNDDEVMMWLVSGAYTGVPESYAVFIHPVLTGFFSLLYTWFSGIAWYALTWFALIFLSYAVFIRFVHQKMGTKPQGLVWKFLLLAALIHFTFFLQFSIVSAFCISAGLVNRLGLSQNTEKARLQILNTDLLVLMGILIRWEVGVVLIGASLGFLLVFGKGKNLIRAGWIPVTLLVMVGLSHVLLEKSSDLDQFSKINKLRSQVFDHPMLQLHKEHWEEKEQELFHFSNGLQDFTAGNLEEKQLLEWKDLLDSSRSELLSPEFFLQAWVSFVQHEHFFLFLLVASLFLTILSRDNAVNWSLILIFLGLNFLIPFYLLKIQVFALVFFLMITLVLISDGGVSKVQPNIYHVMSGILILGIAWHMVSIFSSEKNIPDNNEIKETLSELHGQGLSDIYLIGESKWYHSLVFENPLPFKVLGWPSLLEFHKNENPSSKRGFLVQNKTFFPNESYFQTGKPKIEFLEEFVLITYP